MLKKVKSDYLGITDKDFGDLATYAALKTSSIKKMKNAFLHKDFEALFYQACWAKQEFFYRKSFKNISSLENTANKMMKLIEENGEELTDLGNMYHFMLEEYRGRYNRQLGIVSDIPRLTAYRDKNLNFDMLIQQIDIIACRAKLYRSSSFGKSMPGQKSLEPFKNYTFKVIEIYETNTRKKFKTSRQGRNIKRTDNFIFLKLATDFLNREISSWAQTKGISQKKLLYTDQNIMTAYESYKKHVTKN